MFGNIYLFGKMNRFRITILDGDRNDGTPVVSSSARDTDDEHQRWALEDAGDGHFWIFSPYNEKVIGTRGGSREDGAALVMGPKEPDAEHQLWVIVPLGNSLFHLRNKLTGFVIDVFNGDRGEGAQLIAFSTNDPVTDNQVWSYEEAPKTAPAPTKPDPTPTTPEVGLQAYVSPILNVSDVAASVRWFQQLGWVVGHVVGPDGAVSSDEPAAGATYAFLKHGWGQLYLSLDSQGLRGDPVAPGSGDTAGATWQSWWLYTPAAFDELYQRAVAAGVTVVAAPEDKPWGQREARIAHPDGHVFRLCAPLAATEGVSANLFVTPILNVADVALVGRQFRVLGWQPAYSFQADGGYVAGEDAAEGSVFACMNAGHGQVFLSLGTQGQRGGEPVAPGSGDDVGATWQSWYVGPAAALDRLAERAVAAGFVVISPPQDRFGLRELRIALPDGHVFRAFSAPA